MGSGQSKIVTDLQVDDAHQQTARAFFDAADRQYLDNQIRGCQQHLVDGLINGTHATWIRVAATSPSLTAGDVVCLAGLALGYPVVTLATAAALAVAGCAYGVVLRAAAPGARALVALDGVVGPSVTGLGATAGVVRVSSAGRPQRVASYSTGDYPLGTVDSQGYLTIARGAAVASTGGDGGGSSRREYVVQHVAGPIDPEEPWVYYVSGQADVELELVLARVSLVTPSGAVFSIGQGPVIQILSRTSGGSETVIAELDLDGLEMVRGNLVAMTPTGATVATGRLVAVKITNDDIEAEVPQLSIIAVFQPA
ncbi:hypothetical protein [Sorangium sp. So ce233]|uniref:hypothetical protein n=1 Tax=Sorangium sp. So ce233 TaxID=3133290 RepID=UPI003F608D27